jgi:hypothetical protein
MSPPGRPKGEYRSAQREGIPVSAVTLEVGADCAWHVIGYAVQ